MKLCELCDQRAFVYCSSDSAFLCWDCDAKVHAANFLVARHAREALCLACEGLAGEFISGSGLSEKRRGLCGSCSPEIFPGDGDDVVDDDDDDDSLSSFSSSSTNKKVSGEDHNYSDKMRKIESISSSLTNLSERFSGDGAAVRSTKRRVVQLRAPASNLDAKAEGIFVIWSRKFGVDGNVVVSSACHALMFCLGKMTVLPFRVALAASFWFSLRLCGNRTASTWQQQVRRLEDISGVPAKQILAVESKLARVLRVSREPQDLKEGWAECNA